MASSFQPRLHGGSQVFGTFVVVFGGESFHDPRLLAEGFEIIKGDAGAGVARGAASAQIARLRELVAKLGVPKDRFEFQALLGVPVDDVLTDLVSQGYTVRWYVPFGDEWYAYSTRRLKENPKMATYIVRHWFGR